MTLLDNTEAKEEDFTLRDVSLAIRKGELAILCGEVGCGKSSILSAVLGEIRKSVAEEREQEQERKGKEEDNSAEIERKEEEKTKYKKRRGVVKVGGKIAYVGEEAWVLRGSVRDNILFGLPFNAERYAMVSNFKKQYKLKKKNKIK